jgi:hypothetical protein
LTNTGAACAVLAVSTMQAAIRRLRERRVVKVFSGQGEAHDLRTPS